MPERLKCEVYTPLVQKSALYKHIYLLPFITESDILTTDKLTDEIKEGDGDEEVRGPVEARRDSDCASLDVGREQLAD